MIDFLKRLQVKSDPRLIAFAMAVTALAIALVLHGDLTTKEAVALLGAALISPAILGEKAKPQGSDDDDIDGDGGGTPSGSRIKAVLGESAPADPPKLDRAARLAMGTLMILVTMTIGCTPGQREGARTVLDAVQTACIIANAALPKSKVAEICGIADGFFEPLDTLLASSRAAAATRMNAGAVSTDQRAPVVCAQTNNGVECWEAPPVK